ncbi:glycosyltransferase family 2 protein [Enterococcus eurekensis]|uniref:Glycosyltransferase family 2 protein n=1 Tax=Enterococcus eurekensis TaxID=1159753 RepID=A0ABV9M476_9ENTE
MKISVVVPVYNVQEYLVKCLESIVNQTYSELEIILINDGSTDDSGRICDDYAAMDKRIKVIHQENGGLSAARNTGIKIATSEWITFIDSDDYVAEDYIEYLICLALNNDADVSIGTYTYVTKSKEIDKGTGEVSIMDNKTAIRRMLLDQGFDMGAWAKMYKTTFFDDNLYPVGKLYEDSFTTYRVVSKAQKVAFGSKSIYYYINREDSIVNRVFNERKLELIEMNKLNENFIRENFPSLLGEAKRRVLWSYFSTLNQVLSTDNSHIIEKYSPDLINYIITEGKFIVRKKYVPLRDKIAYLSLKYLGVTKYKQFWSFYLKIKK